MVSLSGFRIRSSCWFRWDFNRRRKVAVLGQYPDCMAEAQMVNTSTSAPASAIMSGVFDTIRTIVCYQSHLVGFLGPLLDRDPVVPLMVSLSGFRSSCWFRWDFNRRRKVAVLGQYPDCMAEAQMVNTSMSAPASAIMSGVFDTIRTIVCSQLQIFCILNLQYFRQCI